MKRVLFLILFTFVLIFAYSENTISSALRKFDNVIFETRSGIAETSIGFITYADTNTCGTVAEWFRSEIEKAANDTRRIHVVSSSHLDEQEKVVLASRGHNSGIIIAKKNPNENKYAIDGIYIEKNERIELELSLRDHTGKKICSENAVISSSTIKNLGLSLYPQNLEFSKTVQKDFEKAVKETSNGKITVTASMIDTDGNLVNILHPGDIVRFMIAVDSDAYIAIQGIDAEKDSYWLPVENPLIPAGEMRIFPDGDMEYQVMNGIFGAEQLIIHASSSLDGLPNQNVQGLYTGELISKSRGMGAVRKKASNGEKVNTGLFKISYTVVE